MKTILPIMTMLYLPKTEYMTSYWRLSEGLIQSYPTKSLIKHLKNFYNFKLYDPKNELSKEQYEEMGKTCNGYVGLRRGNNDIDYIKLAIHDSEKYGNIEKINFILYPYGWFLAIKDYSKEYEDLMYLTYEKKYSSDTPVDFYDDKYLYHICSEDIFKKISTKGLLPKDSQDLRFTHSDRVYCYTRKPKPLEFKERSEEFKAYKFKHANKLKVKFYLLKIDLDKIRNLDFYYDPRYYGAVYTLNSIRPDAIEKIDEITV